MGAKFCYNCAFKWQSQKRPLTSRNILNKMIKRITTYVSVQNIETEEDSKQVSDSGICIFIRNLITEAQLSCGGASADLRARTVRVFSAEKQIC